MLEFSSVITNHSEVILNELQLPFVSAASFGVAHNEEVFYIPDGIGSRTVNPRQAVAAVHTEYMSADYKSTWMTHSYPPTIGRFMSMPWMGLQFGEKYLYFGEHNPEMRIVGFNIGISPRHTESELMFCISHYPAVHHGETVECGKSVMALFEGDWRDGAALYKKWSEETWFREQNIVSWAKEITGWQRVILKHQYGEIYFRYEDLPRLYLEGKKYGLNALMVFGWWKGRFDNNYPEYEPDPALGGAEKLKEAIKEVQRLGGHVILYSNGNLIDVKTDFYKRIGQKISHKDIDGNEYREHYQFSNDGTILRTYGYKSFDTACHRTPEWKDNLLNVAALKLSFGPDSIFFDQLGCALKLCFDSAHPHGYRIDEDGMGRFENIGAIREITPQNVAIGTESGIEPVTCAVVGALLGFLLFNFHPASVFMGDTGSLALGGFVASAAIVLQMPLFILIVAFIYVIEVLSVILQVGCFKLTKGKRIFKMAPIHHHFELSGWRETKVVAVFTIITAVLCLLAFLGI
jgi:hypothetical protein